MKKILFFSIALIVATFCQAQTIMPGVEKTLAEQRSRSISNIHYQLHFDIPTEGEVKGNEIIHFQLKENTADMLLDFKAVPSQLATLTINGTAVTPVLTNEHIVLPQSLLSTGDNQIDIAFIAGKKALNWNTDFLYTLFVPDKARTVFPCFDQPDLKALFTLQLSVPETWSAVSNMPAVEETIHNEVKTVSFAETKPLPTYLFSFVTGKFMTQTSQRNGKEVTAYYREDDNLKVAQLPEIFDAVFQSIAWMEDYTSIPMPFPKYDFIIIPGFQFGGMEHPGAILYNDKRMFLSKTPTPDDLLNRMELIAHETAHLWFGDLVTMRWFNDVWTKEVFANYLAAKIMQPKFPKINHSLNFLKSYHIPALSEDCTAGTHPIQQDLDNLQDAGLLYGNIIYDKSPVMMRKLEEVMGSEDFQYGLRQYLKTYSYANATWDNLIDIFAERNNDVKNFSEAWVKQRGLPEITFSVVNNQLIIRQVDPYREGILWMQSMSFGLIYGNEIETKEVFLKGETDTIPLRKTPDAILPNYNGKGYGIFVMPDKDLQYLLYHWYNLKDEVSRESALINLYENYLIYKVSEKALGKSIVAGLPHERNELILSTCCSFLAPAYFYAEPENLPYLEQQIHAMSRNHPVKSCRQGLLRLLINYATGTSAVNYLYQIWEKQNEPLLNESDYMNLAYQLSIHKPQESQRILNTQRNRLTNDDRLREFDFIRRACVSQQTELDALFESLKQKENRSIEPWTQQVLQLLNHPLREPASNRYIRPGLDLLQEVQQTGDIFFAKGWATALLSGHKSTEAKSLVRQFIVDYPEYPSALKNKLLQAAYMLLSR